MPFFVPKNKMRADGGFPHREGLWVSMKNNKTRMITESAIMIALSVVLSMITIFRLPQGGSITAASMVPLLIVSYRYNARWGCLTAFVYSLVQIVTGFYPPPVTTFVNYLLVILLDYVIAFSVIGLASLFSRVINNNRIISIGFGSFVAVFCRLLCHVLSGVVIWGSYAPEGVSVWVYSIGYNGSYMLCEAVVSTVVMCLLAAVLDFKTLRHPKAETK